MKMSINSSTAMRGSWPAGKRKRQKLATCSMSAGGPNCCETASRVSTAFETWPRYDAARRKLAKAELDRMLAAPALSGDLQEMLERMRAAG